MWSERQRKCCVHDPWVWILVAPPPPRGAPICLWSIYLRQTCILTCLISDCWIPRRTKWTDTAYCSCSIGMQQMLGWVKNVIQFRLYHKPRGLVSIVFLSKIFTEFWFCCYMFCPHTIWFRTKLLHIYHVVNGFNMSFCPHKCW